MSKTLLPAGCYDVLPPHARQTSELSSALLSVFENFGYEQVAPPLLEYSENLLAGRGAALSPQIFRVMDPGAHKVMGIRADITMQIARIAMSRLSAEPRPLRLSYNGLILRMQGEHVKGDRQLRQAGIELIGTASPEADAEVIFVAATALERAGIKKFSIDLTLPGIVSSMLAGDKLSAEQLQTLLDAVTHKDISAVRGFKIKYRDSLIALMQCAGPAPAALKSMAKIDMPAAAKRQCKELEAVVKLLSAAGSDWTITVDPTESRGFVYENGLGFSIFVPGIAQEVGRGGRYRIDGSRPENDTEATGFTLYVETLRGILPEPKRGKRVLVAEGITSKSLGDLRKQGFVVINALPEFGDDAEEAKRLGCSHIYKNGKLKTL